VGVFLLKHQQHPLPKKIVRARKTTMELIPKHAPNALMIPLDLVEIPEKLLACAIKATMEKLLTVHARHAREVLPTLRKPKTNPTKQQTANATPTTTLIHLLQSAHLAVTVIFVLEIVQRRLSVNFALLDILEKQ